MSPLPLRATYRVQLGRDFGFPQLTAALPYLAALGVSHVYCSPYLKARAGSTHGYDIVDHNALNPEVGDERAFAAFVEALRSHGMGHVLDFVPNHMGIAQADNAWWLDLLEWGPTSPSAEFFDVDWHPTKPELHGKVLLPFLGDHYGRVLERGELQLRFDADAGSFSVWYHEHRFPITPAQYGRILGAPERHLGLEPRTQSVLAHVLEILRHIAVPARVLSTGVPRMSEVADLKRMLAQLAAREPAVAEWIAARVARLNGTPGRPRTFRPLDRLLSAQHYRLAYWRVAADEVNYRRFFDVNDLAGLRVEDPGLFDRMHRLVLRLVADGRLDGLRIDHIDGLFDPLAYCERLRALIGDDTWLLVEKILAADEALRPEWPVGGTTGYEFLARVNGLFVDPAGEAGLTRAYRELAGETAAFDDVAYNCKKLVMNFILASELHVLARALDRISETDWQWRDFTATSLREGLKEIVACLPVYRTYVDAHGATPLDREVIARAVAEARSRSAAPEATLYDFLEGVLSGEHGRERAEKAPRADVLQLARRVQQFSGPVMAKAVEDTAFYRYHRLVSLNEVGGDPRRFGTSVAAFHDACREQREHWPDGMLTTATHDTKRGEDVRARLNVLAELPDAWTERARRWSELTARHARTVAGARSPSRNEEYLLWQTLVGSWPVELTGVVPPPASALAAYQQRLDGYVVKALREAKDRSSWRYPDEAHEQAVTDFLHTLLTPGRDNAFLADFVPFQERIAVLGVQKSLGQLALKLTAPGVPDVYQGTELWDLSLVDPDNRRPVDLAPRAELLAAFTARFRDGAPAAALRALLADWRTGAVKLFLLWRLLACRREHPTLFARGAYEPLAPVGPSADALCAFARTDGDARLVVVVPLRSVALHGGQTPAFPAGAWEDTAVTGPPLRPGDGYRDVVSGADVTLGGRDGRGAVAVGELLERFPVAVLLRA